jgi:hypothetical protein
MGERLRFAADAAAAAAAVLLSPLGLNVASFPVAPVSQA